MNRKAQIFHWTVIGLLVAIGIFFMVRTEVDHGTGVRGEWQKNFITENYGAAEAQRVSIEARAAIIGREVLKELAQKGGFQEADVHCGEVNGMVLWNKKEEWCLLSVKDIAASLVEQRLVAAIPERRFSAIRFDHTLLRAQGLPVEIVTAYGKYSFDTGFTVDVGSSLEEYDILYQNSVVLVNTCRNQRDLGGCLQLHMLEGWQQGGCGGEFIAAGRKQVFCSSSSSGMKYMLALDFTPLEPFPVEGVGVLYSPSLASYELTFSEDADVEAYSMYFTDYVFLGDSQGYAADLRERVRLEYFWDKYTLAGSEIVDACPEQKQPMKGYRCVGKIVYLVQDARLVRGKEYLFAVTSVAGGKESRITGFVKHKTI